MVALHLRDGVSISESDLEVRYVRSSGPGGQNVNKVATKVEVRLHLARTVALSEALKRRLVHRFPSHVTGSGEFIVASDRFRSQPLNQGDALERLRAMILAVWSPPRPRKKTKPSRASVRRRIADKRLRGDRKRERSRTDFG